VLDAFGAQAMLQPLAEADGERPGAAIAELPPEVVAMAAILGGLACGPNDAAHHRHLAQAAVVAVLSLGAGGEEKIGGLAGGFMRMEDGVEAGGERLGVVRYGVIAKMQHAFRSDAGGGEDLRKEIAALLRFAAYGGGEDVLRLHAVTDVAQQAQEEVGGVIGV
jgi:hypothetical protein